MAHENTWSSLEDGQPTGANLLGQVDDFVRQTRQMVRERIALEHDFNFLINDQQGYHRQGSARVWVSDTQPTSPIPDPTSTETSGSETIGRCWFKPSTGEYFVYNNASASWIPVNLTTSQMAALLHAMTAKTSLVDNDEFALADSAAAYGPKKTLWSTVKSVIKTALSIGGSNALTEDDIGDGTSYKRIGATKADKINTGTYSEDDVADGTSYKRVQAAKADKINGGTYSQDDIADGTSYARVLKAKADKINGGTYSEDDIADGTSYARLQKAKADAINADTYKGNLMPYTGMMKSGIVSSTNSTTPQSTGISVNAGSYSKDALLMISGHTAAGDNTYTALFHLRFGYDGGYWQSTLLSAQSPGGGNSNIYQLSVTSGILHINTSSSVNFIWTMLGNRAL